MTLLPHEPISPRRLYKKVADQIAQLILNGEFKSGQKLPGERYLIERLGVSRSSLREALISLEIEGLVEIRDRAGVFVLGHSPCNDTEQRHANLPEIFAARELIEIEVAAQAACHALPEHIKTLTQIMGKMVTCSADDPLAAAHDREFHMTLAQACGNRVLLRTVELLWNNTQPLLEGQSTQAKHSETSWLAVVMEHRNIFNAIRDKNSSAAQEVMRQHLIMANQRLLGALH